MTVEVKLTTKKKRYNYQLHVMYIIEEQGRPQDHLLTVMYNNVQ